MTNTMTTGELNEAVKIGGFLGGKFGRCYLTRLPTSTAGEILFAIADKEGITGLNRNIANIGYVSRAPSGKCRSILLSEGYELTSCEESPDMESAIGKIAEVQ